MRIRKILTVALLTAAMAGLAFKFAASDAFAQAKAPVGAAVAAPAKSAALQDVWFDIKLNAIDKEIGYANLLVEETTCKLTETSEEEPAFKFKLYAVFNPPAGVQMEASEALLNFVYLKKDLTFFSASASTVLRGGKTSNLTFERRGDKLRVIYEDASPDDIDIKSWDFYPEFLGAWVFTKKQMKVGDKADVKFITPAENTQALISDGQIIVTGLSKVGEAECTDVTIAIKSGAKERTLALKVNNREGWQQVMQDEALTWRNAPKEKFEKGKAYEARGRKSPMISPLLKKEKMVNKPFQGSTGPSIIKRPTDPGTKGPSAAELLAAREKLTGIVDDIKKLVAAKKDDEANRLTSEFVKQWTLWADVGDDAHKAEMKKIWDDFIRFRPLPEIALADATVFYGKIVQLVNEPFVDNFKAVYAPVSGWIEEIKKRAADKVVEGTEQQKKIRDLADRADRLGKTVQTRIEFETKKPKITGIIYMTKDVQIPLTLESRLLGRTISQTTIVRVPQSSSLAIINDKTYGDGENLDDMTTIIRIESDGVRFRYKGEDVKTGF
jgi:hypothetical protein